jgi:hypothetical protein
VIALRLGAEDDFDPADIPGAAVVALVAGFVFGCGTASLLPGLPEDLIWENPVGLPAVGLKKGRLSRRPA